MQIHDASFAAGLPTLPGSPAGPYALAREVRRFSPLGAFGVCSSDEFLKEHKKVDEERASISELKSTVAQQ